MNNELFHIIDWLPTLLAYDYENNINENDNDNEDDKTNIDSDLGQER